MRIQPNSDYVLIQQVEAPKKETTIILSAGVKESGLKPAKVLSVGQDVLHTKENTMVYPIWGDAKPVTIDGVELALIKEESIIAYVTSLE